MAEVWRARDERLDRTVAIKLLHPHLLPDEAARARFVAEARAAAGLTHPGIVPVYDVIDDDETPAIVFQYVPGLSLDDRLRRDGRLPLAETVAIGLQVARALAHAHSAGLIHRDVKPGNILLEDGGGARLLDFGIARLLADAAARSTSTGEVMGTLRYMSPEQLLGRAADARSDLYSLGLTLFEMAAGRPAFDAKTPVALLAAEEAGPPPLPDQPAWFAGLVAGLLAVDPNGRPASAEVVAEELERGAGSHESSDGSAQRRSPAVAFPGAATAAAGLSLGASASAPVMAVGLPIDSSVVDGPPPPLSGSEADPTIVMTGPVPKPDRPAVKPVPIPPAAPAPAPSPAAAVAKSQASATPVMQARSWSRAIGSRAVVVIILLVLIVGGAALAGWAGIGHLGGSTNQILAPSPTVRSQPAIVVTPEANPSGHKGGKGKGRP